MCSFFYQRMENDQGDLADIVRASGSGGTNNPILDWQFPLEPVNFPSGIEEPIDDFGDPFFNMRDPLLHEELSGLAFADGLNSSNLVKMDSKDDSSVSGNLLAQKKILGEDIQRPCNLFSRVLQITPTAKISMVSPQNSSSSSASPRGIKSSLAAKDSVKLNNSPGCLAESGGVQIPLPRNPGMKRRKSQAKKVVCIPAPAAANSSRTSGEVVPSDLWAWRKYGQKPIKGSPYPRGYYRCSSSKGCSARKQVERSRTDPNMLVITYTSEHNHPWPTQRNALAGSTRSQPAKNNSTSKISPSSHIQRPTNLKEEQEEKENDTASPGILEGPMTNVSIKEEMGEIEKNIDMDDHEFNRGFNQSYRPALPNSNHTDDFFADLGELEPDPLNIIFSHGFSGEKSDQERDNKALDPFNIFDWSGNSFGENTRRGL